VRVVAHAGGTGWDEIMVFVIPLVILVILQVVGRRRHRAAGGEPDQNEPHPGEGNEAGDRSGP
jgi:hypothetical protein